MTTPQPYVNPIGSGLIPERIDMGVDYGGSGPLYAIGSGTIKSVSNSGWPGGTFISLLLDAGQYAGKYVYYAEDIAPNVSVGQHVTAGQKIGQATGGGSGIEVGWAAAPGTGNTMAAQTGEAATGGDPGAKSTAYGVSFSNLIASLGGKPGILTPGGITGSVGTGYPSGASMGAAGDTSGSSLGSGCVPLIGYVWLVWNALQSREGVWRIQGPKPRHRKILFRQTAIDATSESTNEGSLCGRE